MDIAFNRNNPIPIGIQVKEHIKMLIYSGDYKSGDKLPSINELALSLGVNKNTIAAVFKELQKEGYVESYRGKGVFVKGKKINKLIDCELLYKVDMVIREAKKKGIGVSELINLISSNFDRTYLPKKIKVLFLMGISQQLVDINIEKLRESIPAVEFEGLLLSKKLSEEKLADSVGTADVVLVPSILYDFIKGHIPEGKLIIKTRANFKMLDGLKKHVEKKKIKVAVIGENSSGAQALAGMFVSAGLFKPKLVLSLDNLEKCRKDLKDIDSLVVCLSAKEEVEKLKMKDKSIYYFSDYVDDGSLREIKLRLREFGI